MNTFNKLITVILLASSVLSAAAYAEEEEEEIVPILCIGDEVPKEIDGTWYCVES